MNIQTAIRDLAAYAYHTGLVTEEDLIYTLNSFASFFGLFELESTPKEIMKRSASISGTDIETGYDLKKLLTFLSDYLKEQHLLPHHSTEESVFARIMSLITPAPSQINRIFKEKYAQSPKEAMDWFYQFSKNTNYVKRYQLSQHTAWAAFTSYGDLNITIDASSDPILFHPEEYSSYTEHNYPNCILCRENIGYPGHLSYPSGKNRRSIPINLKGKEYQFQFLPSAAYPELFTLSSAEHNPAIINKEAFARLLTFVERFPQYFIGQNADLPIVSASLDEHEHLFGATFESGLAKAEIESAFSVKGYKKVSCGILKWPTSVIRLISKEQDPLVNLADQLLEAWKSYSDPSIDLISESSGKKHNTFTLIARKRRDAFELDLILRNNRRDKEHPDGIFYPRREYHHLMYRSIGVLELSGLMIFPCQLKSDLQQIEAALAEKRSLASSADMRRHVDWSRQIRQEYKTLSADNVSSILKKEVGMSCLHMLEDSAVFKRDSEGQDAFARFILSLEAIFD
jgi:UDPglucose--hexose-1-phosphate uridylyltransferase